jgi:hypothetical protein
MAFRDWRARRVIGLCLIWPLLVTAWFVIQGRAHARDFTRGSPNVEVIAAGTVPLSPWLWFGPSIALLAVWWIARRSRPAG